MLLTRGPHLKLPRTRDRPSNANYLGGAPNRAKILNPLLPKDGIEEKMILEPNLTLPKPRNPMEGKDLGSRVLGERGGRRELSSSWARLW